MKIAAVITAGGHGCRMGTELPKQFLELQGQPILLRTLACFRAYDPEMPVVVVIPATEEERWLSCVKASSASLQHQIVHGGADRCSSVAAGLRALGADPSLRVAIHDGVRPLLSHALLHRCFRALDHARAVIPILPLADTLRQRCSSGWQIIDRQSVFRTQTPQCFYLNEISEAYQAALQTGLQATDDAAVFSAHFACDPFTVEGEPQNLKITYPEDLLVASAYLSGELAR